MTPCLELTTTTMTAKRTASTSFAPPTHHRAHDFIASGTWPSPRLSPPASPRSLLSSPSPSSQAIARASWCSGSCCRRYATTFTGGKAGEGGYSGGGAARADLQDPVSWLWRDLESFISGCATQRCNAVPWLHALSSLVLHSPRREDQLLSASSSLLRGSLRFELLDLCTVSALHCG